MNRRSGGGGGGGNGGMNNRGNRYFDNHGGGGGGGGRMSRDNNVRNSVGNSNNQGSNWRQGPGNFGRQSMGGHQGGGGMNQMNVFDNKPFQSQQQHQHQQHQMVNQNQFASQLSNAVLRSSVGSNPGMMSSFGGNQDQPVVMVLPQSQATGGMMGGNMGNMGMVQSQNPFAAAVMNQQKPMQVIVGNLPGLNPAAFGQQVLPAYGQGVGEQNMGMFGQQTQQGSSNRYGRDYKNSSDRGGRTHTHTQRNQKVSLVRRTEANDRGRLGTPRGVAKKRSLVLRDPYPADSKKAKTNAAATPANNRNRVAVTTRKDRFKNRRANKANGNKAAKSEDKTKTEDAKKTTDGETKVEGEGVDSKPTDATAEGTENDATETGEKKPSKYDELPVELLVCKICQKTMNDGASFESHLSGKAHVTLMKILEEKFTKRAELLMYESKMCEDEIAVEMERQRRAGKGSHGGKGSKHHCKMCDCNYTVNWGTHKQSVWHRVLKEFLHPNCRFCKSQFVHRRDWVEHLISVGHLKKLAELKAEKKIIITDQEAISQEELFAVHIEVSKDEKTLNIVNIHSLGGKEPLTEDIKTMLQGENGDIVLPEGEIAIPDKFDENVAVGEDAVFVIGGSCCKVCRIYVTAGEESAHCKSHQHFDCYVEYLKRVVKLRQQKADEEKRALEEAERKAKAEAEAAAKAAEEAEAKAKAAKAEESSAAEVKEDSQEKKEVVEAKPVTVAVAASPAKTAKPEQMDVDQGASGDAKPAPTAAGDQKPDELVVLEEADGEDQAGDVEKMEEDPANIEAEKAAEIVEQKTEKVEPAKPAVTPTPKPPQRGGQNNRGARGSPARGRGSPNPRGGGGYNRGGRGGVQQQQTPVRNTQPRVDSNMRGGRGGQPRGARGGARGSPRGRGGRGGW